MKKMNLPNKLVILRFILAIACVSLLLTSQYATSLNIMYLYLPNVVLERNVLNCVAMWLFVAAAFTDFLDGYLARKNNQVTNFGKLFDPIADKVLVNSVLIIFAAFSRLPIWVAVLFIIRDLAVEGLRMSLSSKGTVLAAGKLGKQKTIWQFIGLTTLFIIYPLPTSNGAFDYASMLHLAVIPLYIGLAFSIISGFIYYKSNWSIIINE